jgi:hypothetical protein
MARKKTNTPKTKSEAKAKDLSALNATAKVLKESGEALSVKEILEAITTKGFWKSPGGKTPSATIYSSIVREIAAKGKDARFRKTERGKFVHA